MSGALDRWIDKTIYEAREDERKKAAAKVREYWDANGDIIYTNNGARLAFAAIAAQIESANHTDGSQ